MCTRIAKRLPFANVVDLLLQGERIERRERKREKLADASIEHRESLKLSGPFQLRLQSGVDLKGDGHSVADGAQQVGPQQAA